MAMPRVVRQVGIFMAFGVRGVLKAVSWFMDDG